MQGVAGACCRLEGIVEGRIGGDLAPPDPFDRTVSKFRWESAIQSWRNALKLAANEIRGVREGWEKVVCSARVVPPPPALPASWTVDI